MGYAGGTTAAPSYHNLGDHTETIQIDYDPAQVSYKELLDVFWSNHNCRQPTWSRQYASLIFFHNEEQRRLAQDSQSREFANSKSDIFNRIVPATSFYLAEGYHQKYYLRHHSLLENEYKAIYPVVNDFVNSTATTRVNAYVGGHGTLASLQEEIDILGLSPEGSAKLLEITRRLAN